MLISNQNLKAVCMFDPGCAGVPAETMMEYVRTRKIELVKPYFTAANPPTVYLYRRLSRSIMDRYVDVQSGDESKAVAAFQYGVTGAEQLREQDGNRREWKPTGKTATPEGEIPTLTDKEMESDLFSRAEQVEIGTVIYNASFLPRWIERGYLVPPSSVSLWARLEHPSADASPSTQPQSSESNSPGAGPQASPTTPEGEKSASGSEQATAATAAGSGG